MYCLSFQNSNLDVLINELQKYDLTEIRLDLLPFGKKEIEKLSKTEKELIFTCRRSEKYSDEKRYELLAYAIENNAAYIDLDIENDPVFIKKLKSKIKEKQGCKIIVSYHNYERMPLNQELYNILLKAGEFEADIIKLACYSNGERDNRRMLTFNRISSRIIAFNMGPKGSWTRAACLLEGAPFTYVTINNQGTAPGQMTKNEIDTLLEELKYYQHEIG